MPILQVGKQRHQSADVTSQGPTPPRTKPGRSNPSAARRPPTCLGAEMRRDPESTRGSLQGESREHGDSQSRPRGPGPPSALSGRVRPCLGPQGPPAERARRRGHPREGRGPVHTGSSPLLFSPADPVPQDMHTACPPHRPSWSRTRSCLLTAAGGGVKSNPATAWEGEESAHGDPPRGRPQASRPHAPGHHLLDLMGPCLQNHSPLACGCTVGDAVTRTKS